MKKIEIFTLSLLCLILLLYPFSRLDAKDLVQYPPAGHMDKHLGLIKERFGPDIARVYETIGGMPVFDPDSKYNLKISYSRDENPCNEIFLEENPDMAEDCKKIRETITYINRHGKKVRVNIKGGEIVSIGLRVPLDKTNPLFCRDVILLHNALIVHDCVLKNYSDNHAKIYHFPGVIPYVKIDKEHNVIFRFGTEDFIKFHAEDFKKTDCQGFRMSCKPTFYCNGTRAIPDISYEGNQLCMVTTNWSYPPVNGEFVVYNQSEKIGKVPANLLYKRLKNDRVCPRFKEKGLLCYLQEHCDGVVPKKNIEKTADRLIETSKVEQRL